MTLLYPWVLLGIPLYLVCERYCKNQAKRRYFSNLPMLRQTAGKGTDLYKMLYYAILLLLFFTLASPVKEQQQTQNLGIGHDISLLLDASESMREGKRFETAKRIIADFVEHRKGDRLSLSVFADYAYLTVPLTRQTQAFNTVLEHLQIGAAGKRHTALYEALYLGAMLFQEHQAHGDQNREKIVILLTDGLNTVKSVPLKTALKEAKKQNLRVYTIGIGDDYRKTILQQIAQETKGRFYAAVDAKALQHIYNEISQLEKSTYRTQKTLYHIPLFRYPLTLILLLMLPLLYLRKRQDRRMSLFYTAFLLMLAAYYGPTVTRATVTKKTLSGTFVAALDLSYSMSCEDSYLSRIQLAKHRLSALIDMLPSAKIGIVGFATQGYLIAAPTRDYTGLKQLLSHIDLGQIHREGSNLLSALQAADLLLPEQKQREVILLTDGGEMQDFSQEISYAKKHHIQINLYAIGTDKGGVIHDKKGLRKDSQGNIIVTRINPAMKVMAEKTGGVYVRHTNSVAALKRLKVSLHSLHEDTQERQSSAYQPKALFWLPLLLALLLLISSKLHIRRIL